MMNLYQYTLYMQLVTNPHPIDILTATNIKLTAHWLNIQLIMILKFIDILCITEDEPLGIEFLSTKGY